jgi:hypothetical protein
MTSPLLLKLYLPIAHPCFPEQEIAFMPIAQKTEKEAEAEEVNTTSPSAISVHLPSVKKDEQVHDKDREMELRKPKEIVRGYTENEGSARRRKWKPPNAETNSPP